MRWEGREESTNVEDRRGQAGGGRGGMMLGGGIGTLILLVVVLLMGGNPQQLLDMVNQVPAGGQGAGAARPGTPEEERQFQFAKVVLRDTEKIWGAEFRKLGRTYVEPRLVVFTGSVRSACGAASAQMGPFYCPADQTVYLDLSFFDELERISGTSGDFARAYVIAHEVGHHVQKLLGVSDAVHEAQQRADEAQANNLSVRLELQADFYAGLWARKAHEQFQSLELGDIEEALDAANAIGDDMLQRKAQGHVVPDSFTHGSSLQRMKWFRKGYETGDIRRGDTFSVRDL